MKAKIISDQHLEFRTTGGGYRKYFQCLHPSDGERADICIVAGDFDMVRPRSRTFFAELCGREKLVLFIPGNHEYYGCRAMSTVDETLHEIEQGLSNLRILRTGTPFHYSGKRFLGDTMWVRKSPELMLSMDAMNDWRHIPGLLDEIDDRHQRFVDWLNNDLHEGDIVVTHHLPSEQSSPTKDRTAVWQPWYVAFDAETLFAKRPSVWIHGHTHQRCDYEINETRVICNPVGYPNEIGKLPDKLAPFVFEI